MIVSGIDADELGHPTPCPKYDVAGLIDHLVEAGHRAAALGRGQAPPPGDESPRVELSDASGQLRSAAEEAAHAWGDNSSLSLRYTMPWGEEYTGTTLVDMYLAELATHAWAWPGPPDSRPAGPFPRLAGTRGGTGHYQTSVPQHGRAWSPFRGGGLPAPGADDWERLAAFMGRNHGQPSVSKGRAGRRALDRPGVLGLDNSRR